MEDCENLNNENENVDLTPEMLMNTKLCFPERIIGGPDPNEWTNRAFIKRFGVPDKLATEDELLPVHVSSSNQKEATNQETVVNVNDTNMSNTEEEHPRMMKTVNNEESILSIANSLEATKPNSIQALEDKVTSDRVCDQEEAPKVGNAGVYEHEKITPPSISKPDGVIKNMTVKDEYGSHMHINKGVTEVLRTDFNDVTEDLNKNTKYLLEEELKLVNNSMETFDSPKEVDEARENNDIGEKLHFTKL